MTRQLREVEDCRFRRPLDAETAVCCELLAAASGVRDPALCRVRRDACEACCRSFPPSVDDLNPVVASLLYELSVRVQELGGLPGCDADRARELMRRALENVPCDLDGQASEGIAGQAPCSLYELIPRPRQRSGPAIRSWAVGVTTAPRAAATLSECVSSMQAAGWERPRLFVDGAVELPEALTAFPRSHRDPQIGAWPNYYLALAELLLRDPTADAYMLVQDDSLFCADSGMKQYLEHTFWPGRRPGIASLFCSRAYTQPRAGWSEFRGVWRWCALAFVFSRGAAQRFLADLDVVGHRWSRRRNGMADISWRVGRWAADARVPVYFPTPSLVQHIGEVSSLWPGSRTWGNRRADWFAGYSRADS